MLTSGNYNDKMNGYNILYVSLSFVDYVVGGGEVRGGNLYTEVNLKLSSDKIVI